MSATADKDAEESLDEPFVQTRFKLPEPAEWLADAVKFESRHAGATKRKPDAGSSGETHPGNERRLSSTAQGKKRSHSSAFSEGKGGGVEIVERALRNVKRPRFTHGNMQNTGLAVAMVG